MALKYCDSKAHIGCNAVYKRFRNGADDFEKRIDIQALRRQRSLRRLVKLAITTFDWCSWQEHWPHHATRTRGVAAGVVMFPAITHAPCRYASGRKVSDSGGVRFIEKGMRFRFPDDISGITNPLRF